MVPENNTRPLVLIGGGGHCRSVIDVAERLGRTILGVLDRDPALSQVLGYPVLGSDDLIATYADKADFIVTVGSIINPAVRMRLHQQVKSAGGRLATLIAPSACVSRHATIGEGTVVLNGACVNAGATIADGCIVNTLANIEHDCHIGSFTHVSTGAMVNGGCRVGDGVFIGSGAVIANCIDIAPGCRIGAGAVAITHCTESGTYVGVPAKIVRK